MAMPLLAEPAAFAAGTAGATAEDCHRSHEAGRNPDGSLLRMDMLVCPGRETGVTVSYAPHAGKALEPMLEQAFEAFHMGQLLDFDGDGFLDVQVTITCAAAPNCEAEIYRFDPKRARLYAYFRWGWADVVVHPEMVVTSVRGGCCSWGFEVHAVVATDPPVVRAEPEFDVTVSMDGSFDQETDAPRERPRCEFGAYRNGERMRIAPPSPDWLDHCAFYGDDFVLLPAPAGAPKPLQ